MAAFEKLQSMLDAAMKQAGEESSMLLGQGMTVAASDVLNTNRKSYLGDEDNPIYVVGVESREAYPGFFYLLFSLGDTIVMSSILLGIPGPRIQEKRRLSIQEPDDVDAFGEIANQIIGSFNSVFQPKLPDKVHLKLLPPQKYVPGTDPLTDELPFPEGEYLMYRAPLQIEGHEMNMVDILIPHPLANMFDPQPEEAPEEAAEQQAAQAETAPQESAPAASILVLGDEEGRRELVEGLAESGLQLIDAPLGADLAGLFAQGEVRLAFISLKNITDRDLAVCKRVVPMVDKRGGAVLLSSHEWTRTAVLKALKAGVKGVVMPPFGPHELSEKVEKFLH